METIIIVEPNPSEETLQIVANFAKERGIQIILVDDAKDAKSDYSFLTPQKLQDVFDTLKNMPQKYLQEIVMGNKTHKITNLPLFPEIPRGFDLTPRSPIDAITTHKKKGKYRP